MIPTALRTTALALGLAALAACAPAAPGGVNKDALEEAVGSAIGDPGACVLLVEKASGKTVWKFGDNLSCNRDLPSCLEAEPVTTVQKVAAAAAKGEERTLSCNSVADGSRSVGWATGTAGDPSKGLAYAAVLESGERALPGREIKTRLDAAFAKAGL